MLARERLLLALLGGFALAATLGASSKALWLDEAYTIHRSAPSLSRVIEANQKSEGSPPLYFVAMHYWLAIGRQPLAVRSCSILCAIGCLWLVASLGALLATPRIGLVAAALLACSSVQLYFAHEARPYMLALLLSLVSTRLGLGLILGREPPSAARWIGWTASSSLATYTLYYAWFAVAAQVALALLLLLRPAARPRLRPLLRRLLPLSALLLVLYTPELLALRGKVRLLRPLAGAGPLQTGIPHPPEATAYPWIERFNRCLPFTTGFQWARVDSTALIVALHAAAALLLIGFAYGLVAHWRAGRRAEALAVLCLFAGPWLLLLGLPFRPHRFEYKHLLVTLPWFCLGLALLVRERPRAPAVALLLLYLGFNGWSNYRNLLVEEKEQWRAVVGTLEAARPGDLVLLKPAYTRIPLTYAAAGLPPALHKLYHTETTEPAVLEVTPDRAPPYLLAPLDQGYAPYLRQAARRGQAIWLVQSWSNVATPLPPIEAELAALGYRRVDAISRLLPGYAGSNATLIQITCHRRR